MFRLLGLLVESLYRCFCSRRDLLLENLALRQQLAIFKQRKQRPKLTWADKLFWVGIKRVWSQWKNCLVLVAPETVVRWHRAGFRRYWHWRSRHKIGCGRRRISRELRELIFQMVAENPTWGAPRIHGELRKLGFDLSERTSHAGCGVLQRSRTKADAGEHSSITIVRSSPQWIFSPSRRLRSAFSTASS